MGDAGTVAPIRGLPLCMVKAESFSSVTRPLAQPSGGQACPLHDGNAGVGRNQRAGVAAGANRLAVRY